MSNRMAINVILNRNEDEKPARSRHMIQPSYSTSYPVQPQTYRIASTAQYQQPSRHSNERSTPSKEPRAPRQKYSDEECYFIWYHRTDLGLPWDKVEQEFQRRWDQPRRKGGLQCKFYRLLDDWGVEKVREQTRQNRSRAEDKVGKFGVVQRTNLRFDWMHPQHIEQPPLPQFANKGPVRSRESICTGCPNCRS